MKISMLINVEMQTAVGILTLISMINTASDNLKASKVFIFQHFSFQEQVNPRMGSIHFVRKLLMFC